MSRCCSSSRPAAGALRAVHRSPGRRRSRRSASASRVHSRDLLDDYALEVSSPGPGASADEAATTSAASSAAARACARASEHDGPQQLHGRAGRRHRRRGDRRRRRRGRVDPVRRHQPQQPAGGTEPMSRRSSRPSRPWSARRASRPSSLMAALEDALLSAYKKTARRGQVRARGHGPRARRLQGVRAASCPRSSRSSCSPRSRAAERAARVDPETGEMREPEAGDRPRDARAVPATRSTSATSRPTTSAASPRRPPSR